MTEMVNGRCIDYPCCGHTDGLGCGWTAPGYRSGPHLLCDHENGFCEVENDEDEDELDDDDGYDDPFRDVPEDTPLALDS